MKIVIVEDERLFRDVLRKACIQDMGHTVVGEAGTGREALEIIPIVAPDLLILDLNLPDIDGLAVLEELRRKRALLRTLIISSYCDEFTIYCVERANVQGFVDKSTNTIAELTEAIRLIAAGGTYHSDRFKTAKAIRTENPRSFDKLLTAREQTILAYLGEPLSDPEIAAKLNLSPETIEKHRFNIMHKLGFRSRAEAARYARRCGLTRPLPRS